ATVPWLPELRTKARLLPQTFTTVRGGSRDNAWIRNHESKVTVRHVEDATTIVFAHDKREAMSILEVALRNDVAFEAGKIRAAPSGYRAVNSSSPAITCTQA